MWEQGVLRAIGLTQSQNLKVFFYEAFCIVASSFICGIATGLFSIFLIGSLFAQIAELPRNLNIPKGSVIFTLVVMSVATYIAVKTPTSLTKMKPIASILKGN